MSNIIKLLVEILHSIFIVDSIFTDGNNVLINQYKNILPLDGVSMLALAGC